VLRFCFLDSWSIVPGVPFSKRMSHGVFDCAGMPFHGCGSSLCSNNSCSLPRPTALADHCEYMATFLLGSGGSVHRKEVMQVLQEFALP
jgi:hypothetical protein